MDLPMIEAHGLKKRFGTTVALDGIDLQVPVGSILGVLGPNGAGKTTAVRILTTLSIPDDGSARVAGHDVVSEAAAVQRNIGVTAQDATLDELLSGRENLVMIGRLSGLRRTEARGRATDLLDRFDLADAADRMLKTYSGGMRRRLDLAASLVTRPPVLFLDEPTTGLDPESRTAMWQEIARLAGSEGLTVLLTTHYLEEADRLAGRLAIVDRGRVVASGTPDDLKGELHGDVVQVALPADADASLVRSVLAHLPEVRDVVIAGRDVSARSDDGAAAVPVVLAQLQRAGINAASVAVARPSLDDVYLRHAGRRYSETPTPEFETQDRGADEIEHDTVEASK